MKINATDKQLADAAKKMLPQLFDAESMFPNKHALKLNLQDAKSVLLCAAFNCFRDYIVVEGNSDIDLFFRLKRFAKDF